MTGEKLNIKDTDWSGLKGRIQAHLLNNRWRARWENLVYGKLTGEIERLFENTLSDGGIFYDIGCGSGFYSLKALALHPKVRVRGVDLSREMIAVARTIIKRQGFKSRFTVVHAPAERTGYPKNSGTFAFASNLLHETTDPQQVLKEIHRLLKIDGVIGIVDFLATKRGFAFTRHHGSEAHGPFEPEQLRKYLEACGFGDVEIITAKNRLLAQAHKILR